MLNKRARFLQQQKIAVRVVLFTVGGILVYLLSVLATDAPLGEYEVHKHYSLIENPRRVRGDKIEVIEFFSYGCVHCFTLDPDLESWVKNHQHQVKFMRIPALGNALWRSYGRAYFTMKTLGMLEQGHGELFGQIHNNGKTISTAEEFADLLTSTKSDRKEFISAYNASNTTRLLERADKLARQLKIVTVPNIVVDGKFLVKTNSDVGLSRILEIMSFLLVAPTEPLAEP